MKPMSEELKRLLNEEIEKYDAYLNDILPQAEAYQRDVARTRDIIRKYQRVLEIEADLPAPPKE